MLMKAVLLNMAQSPMYPVLHGTVALTEQDTLSQYMPLFYTKPNGAKQPMIKMALNMVKLRNCAMFAACNYMN